MASKAKEGERATRSLAGVSQAIDSTVLDQKEMQNTELLSRICDTDVSSHPQSQDGQLPSTGMQLGGIILCVPRRTWTRTKGIERTNHRGSSEQARVLKWWFTNKKQEGPHRLFLGREALLDTLATNGPCFDMELIVPVALPDRGHGRTFGGKEIRRLMDKSLEGNAPPIRQGSIMVD